MEAIENALVCGACLLYQGRGEKAEVSKVLEGPQDPSKHQASSVQHCAQAVADLERG